MLSKFSFCRLPKAGFRIIAFCCPWRRYLIMSRTQTHCWSLSFSGAVLVSRFANETQSMCMQSYSLGSAFVEVRLRFRRLYHAHTDQNNLLASLLVNLLESNFQTHQERCVCPMLTKTTCSHVRSSFFRFPTYFTAQRVLVASQLRSIFHPFCLKAQPVIYFL